MTRPTEQDSSFGFAVVVMVLVLGIAGLLVPITGLLLASGGFPTFGTRLFFLPWAVFPWASLYTPSALGPYSPTPPSYSPAGPPIGDWANLLQWLIVTIAFAAITRRQSRWLVMALAVATVIAVTVAVDSLLVPRLGLRFYLVGP